MKITITIRRAPAGRRREAPQVMARRGRQLAGPPTHRDGGGEHGAARELVVGASRKRWVGRSSSTCGATSASTPTTSRSTTPWSTLSRRTPTRAFRSCSPPAAPAPGSPRKKAKACHAQSSTVRHAGTHFARRPVALRARPPGRRPNRPLVDERAAGRRGDGRTGQLQRHRADARGARPRRGRLVPAHGPRAAGLGRARIVLRFDAATHRATAWVGDTQVAEHEGGYTPFEADVTEHVPRARRRGSPSWSTTSCPGRRSRRASSSSSTTAAACSSTSTTSSTTRDCTDRFGCTRRPAYTSATSWSPRPRSTARSASSPTGPSSRVAKSTRCV